MLMSNWSSYILDEDILDLYLSCDVLSILKYI